METILIAGGSGLIGKELSAYWKAAGHEVRLLTRGNAVPESGIFHWDPDTGKMDEAALDGVTVLVNLCGAGIGDKRWTKRRKLELFDSRVGTTRCLWLFAQSSDTLQQYISASGAVCYGFANDEKTYAESDPFGKDLMSVLTKEWEQAADLFAPKCVTAKVRTGIVLSGRGGALPVIARPVRMGFGAILGSGKQGVPWVHIRDIVRACDHIMTNRLNGAYHATAANTDNATLTHAIARRLNKKLWLPKAPAWVLRLVLGEMSELVLKGVKTDNKKIRSTGFEFEYTDLDRALEVLDR
jgi:uncharacterized protein